MKLITIQSNDNFKVYAGNVTRDNTADDSKTYALNPEWTKTGVLIKKGIHTYPAEMKDWPSVKSLEGKVLTVSSTEIGTPEEEDVKAVQEAKKNAELGKAQAIQREVKEEKRKAKAKLEESLLERAMKENVKQN